MQWHQPSSGSHGAQMHDAQLKEAPGTSRLGQCPGLEPGCSQAEAAAGLQGRLELWPDGMTGMVSGWSAVSHWYRTLQMLCWPAAVELLTGASAGCALPALHLLLGF